MGHQPHLLLDSPWEGDLIALTPGQHHHLTTVLRLGAGETVTYTDGQGNLGSGLLEDTGAVVRGQEHRETRPVPLDVAVAPPGSKDRTRFIVEKLAELGVSRLLWLKTEYGANRPPSVEKTEAWAKGALEQSRGAWLMSVEEGLVGWSDVEAPIAVCTHGGGQPGFRPRTVVVGPEGGFANGEVPRGAATWELVPGVLRVETAAIVAAALALGNQRAR